MVEENDENLALERPAPGAGRERAHSVAVGFALGLAAGVLFGLSGVFIKMGMRRAHVDNGHFMSVLVNWMLIFTVALFVTLPRWNLTGILLFILAGTVTSFVGRGTTLAAIRLIGPARQGTILISAPLFAGVLGWIILGEGATVAQGIGAVVVILGLVILMRSRSEQEGPVRTITVEQMGFEIPLIARTRAIIRTDSFTRGVLIALASALFFGTGFVLRKAGLNHMPSAVIGALFGSTTGLSLIVIHAATQSRLPQLLKENFKPVPWMFAWSGVVSGAAQLFQFKALDFLQAWIVSLLQGTQGLWTLLWAYLFLKEEERITREVVISVLLVMTGIAIMTIRS